MAANCLITSLILLLCSYLLHSYIVVRSSDSKLQESIYLISNGVIKEIPNPVTVKTYGLDPDNLKEISLETFTNLKSKFTMGPPVPLIVKQNESPDEHTRTAIMRFQSLSDVIVEDITFICARCCNPGVGKWNGHYVMIIEWYKSEQLRFCWWNQNGTEFSSDQDTYLGISTTVGPSKNYLSDIELLGLDGRILVFNETRFTVTYCSHRLTPFRMSVLDVRLNPLTKKAEVNFEHYGIIPDLDAHVRQKNWIPFLYKDDVFYIQSINPLIIVSVYKDSEGVSRSKVVSKAETVSDMDWKYGILRGGSTCLHFGDYYLSFFHSISSVDPTSIFITYFFGAFAYSADPPFRLLGVSYSPIMEEKFYTGPWCPHRYIGKRLDYAPYPTAVFQEEKGDHLTVFIGHNDYNAYSTRINLTTLLASIQPLDKTWTSKFKPFGKPGVEETMKSIQYLE